VVEAITAATVNAFEELCQTPVVSDAPFFTHTAPGTDEVTAAITLQRTVPGRLLVCFPGPVLAALAGRYLAGESPLSREMADDAAGEFANVIAGQTKTMLKGTPFHFHLSPPRVGPPPQPADDAEFLALPFDCDAGRFTVRVHLPPCDEAATT
jgi:CheY-specific phosphatase CheX